MTEALRGSFITLQLFAIIFMAGLNLTWGSRPHDLIDLIIYLFVFCISCLPFLQNIFHELHGRIEMKYISVVINVTFAIMGGFGILQSFNKSLMSNFYEVFEKWQLQGGAPDYIYLSVCTISIVYILTCNQNIKRS